MFHLVEQGLNRRKDNRPKCWTEDKCVHNLDRGLTENFGLVLSSLKYTSKIILVLQKKNYVSWFSIIASV